MSGKIRMSIWSPWLPKGTPAVPVELGSAW